MTDPALVPPDKIQLLMEETGCDRAQAELAMSLAGYNLEKAIRTIDALLRDVAVVKGKFQDPGQRLYGLFLLIADTRRHHLLRARAVVSHNPGLYEAPLGGSWFDFEKRLYAGRLAEGARQQFSQDLERALADGLDGARAAFVGALEAGEGPVLRRLLEETLEAALGRPASEVDFAADVIDRHQFRRLPLRGEDRTPSGPAPAPAQDPGRDLLLDVAIIEDPDGVASEDLRAGDTASVRVSDARDIAQYLAKLLGAAPDDGGRPFEVPVEEVRREGGAVRVEVRLSPGLRGVAVLPEGARTRASRRGADRWWRRFWTRSRR